LRRERSGCGRLQIGLCARRAAKKVFMYGVIPLTSAAQYVEAR
jgi:hypothetical protein